MLKKAKIMERVLPLIVVVLLGALLSGVGLSQEKRGLVLATTTSTRDSGLLDQLLPVFETKNKIKVKVLAVGTGQAIKIGELGDCDVILVHARAAEDQFVAEGFGVNRRDVMYNDYILVGPESDPARIKGLSIKEAFTALANGKGVFISRGDDSGTHKKELELWASAGIKTEGQWYKAVGKGMGDTLIMANELGAYTLTDRGTYASMKDRLALKALVSGDAALFNPYGVIAVNPQRHSDLNYQGAMDFIKFITSAEAKKIINGYQVNGEQLFSAE